MTKPLLTASLPPHVYSKTSVNKLMRGVVLALMPALIMGIYVFGFDALRITLIAIFSCIVFEYIIQKCLLKVKPTITDGSAIITALLLAYNVPSSLPWWMMVIGSFVAIAIAKMSFGGLGNNIFNPALVGRVFLVISFPVAMTSWPKPIPGKWIADGITSATPLGILKEGVKSGETISHIVAQCPSYWDLFVGTMGGCIGEISALALLLGLAFMLWKKIITWHIPTSMIGTMAIFTGILWIINPVQFVNPLFHLLTGGVMLGAIFMATDYVTSPMTPKGMIIFGCAIGFLTVIIRLFGAYPEGVSFAILIMNAFVPLINKLCKPKRFGE